MAWAPVWAGASLGWVPRSLTRTQSASRSHRRSQAARSPAEAMGGRAPDRSLRSALRRPPRLRGGRGGRESTERRARGALLRWEALVDHGAVTTFEVELGDNCSDGATGAGDRDRVLRVIRESADGARIDLHRRPDRDRE